uniref:Uncharacterized protein n=1 Tax=Anopheles minimus TaxID=112268 RepID=A0A182VYY2_9DIPT
MHRASHIPVTSMPTIDARCRQRRCVTLRNRFHLRFERSHKQPKLPISKVPFSHGRPSLRSGRSEPLEIELYWHEAFNKSDRSAVPFHPQTMSKGEGQPLEEEARCGEMLTFLAAARRFDHSGCVAEKRWSFEREDNHPRIVYGSSVLLPPYKRAKRDNIVPDDVATLRYRKTRCQQIGHATSHQPVSGRGFPVLRPTRVCDT